MALCIPSHVPLDRLPAATGIHLLFSGLFYIFIGPVVGEKNPNLNIFFACKLHIILNLGWVRDCTNVVTTLHCLNISTYICAVSWILEKIIINRRNKRLSQQQAEEEVKT